MEMVNKIFSSIKLTMNPDVKRNCLEVLYEITLCTVAMEMFCDSQIMQTDTLVCLLKNTYIEIQFWSQKVLNILSMWTPYDMPQRLRSSKFMQSLFDILKTLNWTDQHNLALETVLRGLNHPELGMNELESLELLELIKFSKDSNNDVALAAVTIITEYVKHDIGRQILFEYRIQDVLIELLKRDCDLMKVKICEAFSYFVLNKCLAQSVASKKLILPLTNILGNERLPWNPYRQAAIKTLFELMYYGHAVPMLLYKTNTLKPLREAVTCRSEIDKIDFVMVIEMYQVMFSNRSLQRYLMNDEVFPKLLELIEDPDLRVAERALSILQEGIKLARCRLWFLEFNGVAMVMNIVRDQPNLLADRLTTLLEECARYKILGVAFLHAGVTRYVRTLPKYRSRLNISNSFSDSFYQYDLSLKFFELNRLSSTDITKNGFSIYIGRLPEKYFLGPIEPETVEHINPKQTIISVNFNGRKRICTRPRVVSSVLLRRGNRRSTSSRGLAGTTRRSGISRLLPPKPPACADYDYYLHHCLIKVKFFMRFERTVERRILMLAFYVVKQLSGFETELAEAPTIFDSKVHYAALKKRLQSNTIPLGLLRFGGFVERALLFKVLCDRVHIPCDFIRGHGMAWCELPLLHPHFPAAGDTSRNSTVKRYIVDLMYDVGKLMSTEHWDAIAYMRLGNARRHEEEDDIAYPPNFMLDNDTDSDDDL